MLTAGLEWCGLLVDYCDVFISCSSGSHSDGTHSLQNIHWWAKGKDVTCGQEWWPMLGICALHLTHPSVHTQQWVVNKHTHTHTVNTHQEHWAAINAAAPGEQLWVRCLAQGHLSRGIEGGESAVHSLPPHPTYNPCRSWDSNLQPLGYKSYSLYIRSYLPHLMRCDAMLHFSKSDEETNSSTSWMVWKWAHFQSIFIFGWTGPLMSVSLMLYDHVLYCMLWIYDWFSLQFVSGLHWLCRPKDVMDIISSAAWSHRVSSQQQSGTGTTWHCPSESDSERGHVRHTPAQHFCSLRDTNVLTMSGCV